MKEIMTNFIPILAKRRDRYSFKELQFNFEESFRFGILILLPFVGYSNIMSRIIISLDLVVGCFKTKLNTEKFNRKTDIVFE